MRSTVIVTSLVALLLSTSCTSIPKGEYRSGKFLHTSPSYSFDLPSGWRQALIDDYAAFGFNKRFIQRLNNRGRRDFLGGVKTDLATRESVLISARGAWIEVGSAKNRSARFASGYKLNEQEKQAFWQLFSEALVKASPAVDKPELELKSLEVVDYGPNTVLQLHCSADVQRGSMLWTVLVFFSQSHVVTVAHVGIPEDPDEGVGGLEVIGRTFRFE